jgi:hypothetical protein
VNLDGACRTLIGIAGVDMLSWGGANPQDTLQGLLQVVSRLLQPDMGDSSSLYVGGLIHQLLLKMPAQVQLAFLSFGTTKRLDFSPETLNYPLKPCLSHSQRQSK